MFSLETLSTWKKIFILQILTQTGIQCERLKDMTFCVNVFLSKTNWWYQICCCFNRGEKKRGKEVGERDVRDTDKIPNRRTGTSQQTLEWVISSSSFINAFIFICSQLKGVWVRPCSTWVCLCSVWVLVLAQPQALRRKSSKDWVTGSKGGEVQRTDSLIGVPADDLRA